MPRLRIVLTLFVLAYVMYMSVPQAPAYAPASLELGPSLPAKALPKVQIDSKGAIHLLWTTTALRSSAAGVWYSKYEANGTNSIPPVLIRNSSLVQSADIAVDKFGIPHVAWAEGPAFGNATPGGRVDLESELYYVKLNGTDLANLTPTAITVPGRLVVWPSVAVDNDLTTHLVWTQVDLSGGTKAGAYYGTLSSKKVIDQPTLIANYNQSVISFPRPRLALDSSYGLHMVWVEIDKLPDGQVISSVNYAKLDLKANNWTRREIARFGEQIVDATLIAGSSGSAYVVWQSETSSRTSTSVYVSRISKNGDILFLKELNQPNFQSSATSYLSASADAQDNLYVVWYQPEPPPVAQVSQVNSTPTNIAFLKMEFDGSISQTGNEIIQGSVIAVTVSKSGDLYAISNQGIVRVTNPTSGVNMQLLGACLGAVTALSGAVATEEGRYRLSRSLAPLARRRIRMEGMNEAAYDDSVLRMIRRRPGLTLHDIRRLSRHERPTMIQLVLLEKDGYILSIRHGLSRRFYSSARLESSANAEVTPSEPISLRILNAIERNPGIWEGKLAQDLGLSQQIVHYHLKKLNAMKIIVSQTRGKRRHYRLSSAPQTNTLEYAQLYS